jgi:hypothetical protein
MNRADGRKLVSQLAQDLGWLERHCGHRPELTAHAARLRFAAALVRNCIAPVFEGESLFPLQIAVVGGAGAGKSTVVNFLTGVPAAEANPQAGFTRHPIAYTNLNGSLRWPDYTGFLGPLRQVEEARPANLDEDVYQVRRIPADDMAARMLKNAVIWDCPDMTTWAATGYVPRLLEAAALADVIVYVASDERYNDVMPTQFLGLLLQSGKPVVVCLMKMKEADAQSITAHFRREVLGKLSSSALACLAIPYLSAEQLADPARRAAGYRIPLLNQVAVLADLPSAARTRTVRGALAYLVNNQEELLGAAHQDIAALAAWREVVQSGQLEFDTRYRREYLTSEKFHSFDDALLRLLDLLELPGVGRIVSYVLWGVRIPYWLLKRLTKALTNPPPASLPELSLLEDALDGWLDMLHKEAIRRSDSHPVWGHIEKGFEKGLPERFRERFQQAFRNFQTNLAGEVDRTARGIYEELEKSPARLNTLRVGNFALDVAAIAGALTIGHIGVQDLILVPLLASFKQQIVEFFGQQYVDSQREQIRIRQQTLVMQNVSGPLAEWLIQWPITGGSTFEELQIILRRIPVSLQELRALIDKVDETPAGSSVRLSVQANK